MFDEIKELVCKANIELFNEGCAIYTWGNVSEITDDRKYMAIKPSGVDYDKLTPNDIVIVEVETGEVIEGKMKPSSDTPTHLVLYKNYQEIKGIAHTHSVNAVAFAQAGIPIRALGTTHADYFYGDIPCTRGLTELEVKESYEFNTGNVIIETMDKTKNGVNAVPGILVKGHGPFSWGKSAKEAVYHAVVMEKVAEMNIKTIILNSESHLSKFVLDKHYHRKHGDSAYYGQ